MQKIFFAYIVLLLLASPVYAESLSRSNSDTNTSAWNGKVTRVRLNKEDFLEKLETIHDENKRKRVEQLNTVLEEKNAKWTKHWTNVLERLEKIVDTLEEKGADATALATARATIATAKSAVATQAGKEYIVQISTENNLRADVRTAMHTLKNDLKETQQTIISARDAVKAIAKTVIKSENTE